MRPSDRSGLRRRPTWAFLAGLLLQGTDEVSAQELVPIGGDLAVNAYTTGLQAAVVQDLLPDGGFVALWDGEGVGGAGIHGRRASGTGALLGGEFRVDEASTRHSTDPGVASDPAGGFLVVWRIEGQIEEAGPSLREIRSRRFDSAGFVVDEEMQVTQSTTWFPDSPSVARRADGQFLVVWHEGLFEQYETQVKARRVDRHGAPLGSEYRVDPAFEPKYRDRPRIAARQDGGGFTVVWEDEIWESLRVLAQALNSTGEPVDYPDEVQAPFFEGYWPAIAHGVEGGALVVFGAPSSPDSSEGGVQGRFLEAWGEPLGTQTRLNVQPTVISPKSDVCALDDGGYLVVWEAGYSSDIRFRAFDAHGSPRGSEFVANAHQSGSQRAPALAPRCGVEPWVLWYGDTPDSAASWDVRARRLGIPPPLFADGFELEDFSGWSDCSGCAI